MKLLSSCLALLCGFILIVSMSCTRDVKKSTIELTLGEGVQSSILRGVIINVTAPDMQPIYLSSFNHNSGVGGSYVIEVPPGANRLFQVLGVAYNTTTEEETFQYAEITKGVGTSPETLPVQLAQIGGASLKEVRIYGRYDIDDVFPTGTILVKFHPNSTSPAMQIKKDLMLNGWFETFGIADPIAKFSYIIEETGQVLFDKVSFDDATLSLPFASTATWNLKFGVPKHYRFLGANATESIPFRSIPAMDIYMGHYSYETSTNSFVAPANNPTSVEYPAPVAPTNLFTTTAFTGTPGSYSPSGTLITYSENPDASATTIDRKFGGGGTSCATPFGVQLCLRTDLFNEDSYMVGGFEPPFQYLSGGSEGFGTISTSTARKFTKIKWKYLPGIDLGVYGIKGFDVFVKNNSTGEEGDDDYDCKTLASQGYKIRANSDITVQTANPNTLHTLNVYEADDRDDIVACPYYMVGITKTYYSVAQKIYNNLPPDQEISKLVKIDHVASPGKVAFATNTCEQWKASIVDKYGNPESFNSSQVLRLVTYDNSGYITYFKDSTCLQSISKVSLPANTSSTTFYVKSEQPSPGSYTTANSYLYGYMTNAVPGIKREVNFTSSGSASYVTQYPSTSLAVSAGRCYPLELRFQFSGSPAKPLTPDTVTFAAPDADGAFYSTSDCTGSTITSVTVPTTETFARVYYKTTDAVNAETINITSTLFPNAGNPYPVSLTKVANNQVEATAYAFMPLSHRFEQGDCMPYFFYASEENTYYSSTIASANLNQAVTLNTPGGQAQDSSNITCSSPSAFPNISIPAGSSQTPIRYLKHITSQTIPVLVGGVTNSTLNMSMMPASEIQVRVDTNLDGTADYTAVDANGNDNPTNSTSCVGLHFTIKNTNGANYTFHTSSVTAYLTTTASLGNFYLDSGCTSGSSTSTTFDFIAGTATSPGPVYFKANANVNGNIQIKVDMSTLGKTYTRARFINP